MLRVGAWRMARRPRVGPTPRDLQGPRMPLDRSRLANRGHHSRRIRVRPCHRRCRREARAGGSRRRRSLDVWHRCPARAGPHPGEPSRLPRRADPCTRPADGGHTGARGRSRRHQRRRTRPAGTLLLDLHRCCDPDPLPRLRPSNSSADGRSFATSGKNAPRTTLPHYAIPQRSDKLDLKQANGAELWAKIVACGLIGSGPARLSLVRERFGEGMRCVEFTHVEGGWFLGG